MVDCRHLSVTQVSFVEDGRDQPAEMCDDCYAIWVPVELPWMRYGLIVAEEDQTFLVV